MPLIRKTIPSPARRLSLQVFERFCSEYWRRLLVAGRADLEFLPEEWWGKPDGDGIWVRAATFFARQSEPWREFVPWLFKADVDGRAAKLPEPDWLCSRRHWGAFIDDYAAPANQEVLRHRVLQELRQQQTQFDRAVQDALDEHELNLNFHDGSHPVFCVGHC